MPAGTVAFLRRGVYGFRRRSTMVYRIKGKKILFPQGFAEGSVFIENGGIKAVNADIPFDAEYDAGENFVLPGLIDIHTHGALNYDFADADVNGIVSAVKYHLSHGATSVMPTITSSTCEKTFAALSELEKAMKDEKYGGCILGAHLEGPYFSEKQSGAQDKSLITPPVKADYERITERFGGIIKRSSPCSFLKSLDIGRANIPSLIFMRGIIRENQPSLLR